MVPGKKILIIEDNLLVANDMQRTLLDEGYGVVGIGNTYEQGLHLFLKNDPDLLICDIRLKSDRSGIDLINKIRSLKKLPVIYVTAYTDDITLSEALETNPESYLAKPFTDEQLLVSVYRVFKCSCKDEKCNGIHGAPTNRELEIISNIAKGYSSREIANKMYINFETVQTHRKNILKKFKVTTSAEIITLAHANNWLN